MNFIQWKEQVSDIVYLSLGCALDDLADENYYLNYDSGISAYLMAQIVISNNQ